MWLAGGGVKAGVGYGATDELGYNSVDNIVHVRDLTRRSFTFSASITRSSA